jgi:hypothetical protein
MKRGYRILIVALVAIGTNIGAAFGWCGGNHWRNHRHCAPGEHKNGYHQHGCGNHYNGCADPWNAAPNNHPVDGVKDTVPK